jgi:hypothetical protein
MKILLRIFARFLLAVPTLGLLFAASLFAAGMARWEFGTATAAYLSVGWKIYAGLAAFTFVLFTTLSCHNCFGIESFSKTLKRRGWLGVANDIVAALLWPVIWHELNARQYGGFANAVYNTALYWVAPNRLMVVRAEIDYKTGVATTEPLTQAQARAALNEILTKLA